MMRAASRLTPLVISESLPPRSTITVAGSPVDRMVCRKPSAIDRIAMATATTTMIPNAAAVEAPRRCPRVRRLSQVTAAICESWLNMSHLPQGIDDAQAHRLDPRQEAGQHAEHQGDAEAERDRPRRDVEGGQELLQRLAEHRRQDTP